MLLITTTNSNDSNALYCYDDKNFNTINIYKNNDDNNKLKIQPNCTKVLNSNIILSVESMITSNTNSKKKKLKPSNLILWNFKKQQCDKKILLPEAITVIELSHNKRYLFAGGVSGFLYIWNIETGVLLNTVKAHFRSITCISVSLDDKYITTGSNDSLIHVFKTLDVIQSTKKRGGGMNEKAFLSLSNHTLPIRNLFTGTIRHVLLSCASDHKCNLYNLNNKGRLIVSFSLSYMTTYAIMDSLQRFVYIGCDNGIIYKINLVNLIKDDKNEKVIIVPKKVSKDNVNIQKFKGHKASISCLLLLDDSRILSGSIDGTIRLWNIDNYQVIQVINLKNGPIISLVQFSSLYLDKNYLNVNDVRTLNGLQRFADISTDEKLDTIVINKEADIQNNKRSFGLFLDKQFNFTSNKKIANTISNSTNIDDNNSDLLKEKDEQINKLKAINKELYILLSSNQQEE